MSIMIFSSFYRDFLLSLHILSASKTARVNKWSARYTENTCFTQQNKECWLIVEDNKNDNENWQSHGAVRIMVHKIKIHNLRNITYVYQNHHYVDTVQYRRLLAIQWQTVLVNCANNPNNCLALTLNELQAHRVTMKFHQSNYTKCRYSEHLTAAAGTMKLIQGRQQTRHYTY